MESSVPRYRISGRLADCATPAELGRIIRAEGETFLGGQRWFGGKSKGITDVALRDCGVVADERGISVLALVQVSYDDSPPETYYLPLVAHSERSCTRPPEVQPTEVLAAVRTDSESACLTDGLADPEFCKAILSLIEQAARVLAQRGTFTFTSTPAFDSIRERYSAATVTSVKRMRAEQSNSSVIYRSDGRDALILKSFRKIENGPNPDLELPYFLTTKTEFRNTPPLLGYGLYEGAGDFIGAVAALQAFVMNSGDGWAYTLEHLQGFYEYASQRVCVSDGDATSQGRPVAAGEEGRGRRREMVRVYAKNYLRDVRRLGQVTGELHRSLASDASDPDFCPEPITPADVAHWTHGMKAQLHALCDTIRRQAHRHGAPVQRDLKGILARRQLCEVKMDDLRLLLDEQTAKIRYHGDYHLGQVLKTGADFVIIDFEGEPARPLAERRAKQCPLRDVAGMLRSFNYAAYAGLFVAMAARPEAGDALEIWGSVWERLVASAFLDGYLARTSELGVPFLPNSRTATDKLLFVYQLDKAIYELNYEMNNRPDWLHIPLKWISASLQDA
jgi:trehalose synthase-fused probable maltokinase